ncbi:MAG: sigma-70 family RNA polymerase sigma factor [Planctomycetes bacterium]|nr:sigma-70 family RNA polymerase sigma factor [Planctomycetota bacterium]
MDAPITQLLQNARAGEPGAAEALFSELYGELREIAGRVFRSQPREHTLDPTGLVHEVYVKLARSESGVDWQDRAHFFHVGARVMRQILVNHARDKSAKKRGGEARRERFTVVADRGGVDDGVLDVIALNDELERLAELDSRQARVVELKVFGGLKTSEIAQLLDVSPRTVELDWTMARTWLGDRLRESASRSDEAEDR